MLLTYRHKPDRQTDRHRQRKTDRQTQSEKAGQTDKQKDRLADVQGRTDRQADTRYSPVAALLFPNSSRRNANKIPKEL
jgi:hypothetical protein